jgi:hypothetical protein
MRRGTHAGLSLIAGLALAAAFSGCSGADPSEGASEVAGPKLEVAIVPWLEPAEAVQVAKSSMAAASIDLSRYQEPVITSKVVDSKVEWTVTFQMKEPTPPGGHYTVLVDDLSRKTTLKAGE